MILDWNSRTTAFAVLIADEAVVRAPKTMEKLRPEAIELRLDLVRSIPEREIETFLRSARRRAISVLLTARTVRDGGKWPRGKESDRFARLLHFAEHADAVDMEADLTPGCLGELQKAFRSRTVIFSHHNMKAMTAPAKIAELYKKSVSLGADRFKIAALAKTDRDVENLARIAFELSRGPIPVTTIAMGARGRWTRWVLPRMLGGPSYASESGSAAPGQIPFVELKELLAISK